ncbi:YhcN/YlaJ family sporulation lipoprotein [Halobacillus amylolyticus]|uniref:YhcN/YlaJ family sporulation lipoprotein n=1 Tax=Halobacillus amylolyticus TaxID=2932259 RepID=A0ABY4HF85_9BACI|nr:YhcN/YlaJ family sporulation lipoprotein [Halobacillus amylolyticus]UOR12963.1 YhcN/YlaJ family sporulation lipoprotein [Halobacillus amylolyticus]
MKMTMLIIGLILLSACQQTGEKQLLQEREGSNSHMQYVTDSDPVEEPDKSNQQTARHLAKLAVEVPGVHDATAVVLGSYVAVGIDVDKDLDRSRVGVIKFSVAEALKHDPYGKEAVVIADADGVERLRGIGEKAAQGHPVKAITEELSEIVGRYMPEAPIEDQPAPPDTNKQTIPKEEKEKLEQIEEKQSKEN